MITIPTTELIGCLSDVLPQISDPKSDLAGVRIAWTGEALRVAAYDIYSGAEVEWIPGEGAEGDINAGPDGEVIAEGGDEPAWGGDDAPWATWIWLPQVKDILKLFKLPAKLWRFPVTIKCSPTGDRLTFEREDGPRTGRLLMIDADPAKARKDVPDVWSIGNAMDRGPHRYHDTMFAASRLGAFGTVRPHGLMRLEFGGPDQPVGVRIGSRFSGFVFMADAQRVTRFRFLRDGSGFQAGQSATGKSETPES